MGCRTRHRLREAAWLIAAAFAATSCGGAPAPSPPGRIAGDALTWRAEPSMLAARAAHAVVATDDAIWALAGTGDAAAPVLDVERFDGEAWTIETRLPGDGLNAPAAAILDGRIYLTGGFNTVTNVPSAAVLTYAPETKAWGEAAPLPAPRGGHAAVVLDGRIHVLGGGNSVSTIADHTVFDPKRNTWTDLAPLSRAKGSPAAVVVDGRIWAIGGRSGFSDFGDVEIFDPATGSWTAGPALAARGTAGAVHYRGAIRVFGGESQPEGRCLADALALDPATGVWREGPPLPTPRNFARAVIFRDAVYIVGGSLEAGSSHASYGSRVVESFGASARAR